MKISFKENSLKGIDNFIIAYLNHFVYDVCQMYSYKMQNFDEELVKDRIVLPIGFAPSAIISNLCLKKFDDAIIKGWNPTYYGRYVDDILIVDKVEDNSPLIGLINSNKNAASSVIEHLLCNCDTWRREESRYRRNNVRGLFRTDKKSLMRKAHHNDDEVIEFYINKEFLTFPKSEIKLQSKKVKLFYFDSTKSDALIKCFQKNIRNNISEFRYLPEDEPVFASNDYTEIYSLIEKGGPHKLNGISEMELDKFRLSKFLGKYMRISGLVDDARESQFYADIEKIFTPDILLENYTAWEKILTIFVCNEKFDKCKEFIELVISAISNLDANGDNDKRFKKSLYYFLKAATDRAFALVWGKNYEKIIEDIDSKFGPFVNGILGEKYNFNVAKMREGYLSTRMVDKYAQPLMIDYFVNPVEFIKWIKNMKNGVNFSSMASVLKILSVYYDEVKCCKNEKPYVYYPYMVTIMDLSFANMIYELLNDNNTINSDTDKLKKKYVTINYQCDTEESVLSNVAKHALYSKKDTIGRHFIKVNNKIKNKVKVAIGNAQLREDSLEIILRDEADRSYARYEDVVRIANESFKEKADLLVLPEAYLPVSWLPIFARSCAKNQMAAVVGLEHFKVHNTVYNITAVVLPYTVDDYRYAYIYFHLKTHYAPKEREMIVSRGLEIKEGNIHPMFCWNNFWFSVYCCYEVTSIKDRALYQSYADATVVVEWNMDVNYYNNIVESLVRDLHCYCVQVNISKYGDSRITQPSKTENKDILRLKGGKNAAVLVDEIDIKKLRDFQILGNIEQRKRTDFKVTSPDFDMSIVEEKNKGILWSNIEIDESK